MRQLPRPTVSAALAAVAASLLVGCGSDDEPSATDSSGVVTLRVAVFPIANLAPLYVGIEQGFFEEEGLSIEPVEQGGGAQVITALSAGEVDVGWSSTPGTIIAAAQGLPIRIVAPGTVGPDSADAMTGQPMVVAADSPIQGIEDLAGKKIAVNTVGNILEVTISAALEKAGVDPGSVEFVEIPPPDQPAALATGNVDVISASEPFYTQVTSSGEGRAIFDAFYAAAPSLPTGHWISTDPHASENEDVLARFDRAITEANEYSNSNPDEARAAIPTFTQIPPGIVDRIGLSTWSDDIDVSGLETVQELTRSYGPPDLDEVDLDSLVLE
ncbi:ABC transporter substrate-binding protein [Geodermatophilus sabuli]|uniref:ABC transporter substrate-binding protein n=1 Tax=Geodermatophilus sabuli TaxID=1564158 RepID=A0A7K3VVS1_9ACTN|nr:ABC transporter substrate-binding protein [Geodermatophilus sabuli]NEK56739.1 ABC transporter substrate-binding protein [Geodermatophilus sabuli]